VRNSTKSRQPLGCTGRLRIEAALCALMLGFCGALPAETTTNAPKITQISPGVFEIGKVRLDKSTRSVTFPAVVNMTEAIVEYVVVTGQGKVHESLLRSDAVPKDIHVAMLLLDAKGSGTNVVPPDPLKPIPGDPVSIEVSWTEKGKTKRVPVEKLIFNTQTKTNLSPGPWIYNGSLVDNGVFMADPEGSIVSLITDPFALVNNPRPGRDNDDLCEVDSKSVPPLDTAVEVRITLHKK
jgi:hypothetical protein